MVSMTYLSHISIFYGNKTTEFSKDVLVLNLNEKVVLELAPVFTLTLQSLTLAWIYTHDSKGEMTTSDGIYQLVLISWDIT